MWIILLDRSPSMFEPFTGDEGADAPGRVRKTGAATRWEAARESLLREAESLGPEDLVVIAFDRGAQLVFEGKAAERQRLEEKLAALEMGSGTDVAAALEATLAHVERTAARAVNVEVISDCESAEEPARRAAEALSARVGIIDVLLIDPTPVGLSVAQAISIHGRVTRVVSPLELKKAASEARQRHAEQAEHVAAAIAQFHLERKEVTDKVEPDARLALMLGYPTLCEPLRWADFVVLMHLPGLRDEARARLDRRAAESGADWETTTRTLTTVLRGTWLTFEPRADGVRFNPRVQEVAWVEDIQEVAFRLEADDSPLAARAGVLDVRASGLPIASIPFTLVIGSDPSHRQAPVQFVTSTKMFESIFASYAREDRPILDVCAAAYSALGIQMNVDRNLRPGVEWEEGLLGLINESDAFQLYWSHSSRQSNNVKQEWLHALKLRASKGSLFVRPLYWQTPMPAPAPDLERLNFTFLDLEAIQRTAASIARPSTAPRVATAAAAGAEPTAEEVERRAAALQPTVLPLLAGETRSTQAQVQRQVAQAVAFLEGVTEMRYYPAPTLIVDEVIVGSVRSAQGTADEPPAESDPESARVRQEAASLVEILQPLLLEFHRGYVPPLKRRPQADLDEAPPFEGTAGIPFAAIEGVREFAEWSLHSWMGGYHSDPWDDRTIGTAASTRGRLPLSRVVLDAFDRILAVLEREKCASSKRTLELRFSVPTSSDPSQFDERRAWPAVRQLDGWSKLRERRGEVKLLGPRADDPNMQWNYAVSGEVPDVLEATKLARARLERSLPDHDSWDYSAPGPLGSAELVVLSDATAAMRAINALRDLLSSKDAESIPASWGGPDRFDSWTLDALYPSWRRARDWLHDRGVQGMHADLSFVEFMRVYFHMMGELFERGNRDYPGFSFESAYPVEEAAWNAVGEGLSDPSVAKKDASSSSNSYVKLGGPFAEFVRLFLTASEKLLARLEKLQPRCASPAGNLRRSFEQASTFGIFAPAGSSQLDGDIAQWAIRNRVDPQMTLPGSAKVLLCRSAIEALGTGPSRDDPRLRSLCVLVHEHFHGIVALGLDADSSLPAGPADGPAWKAASNLNEAIAAWMQVHILERLAESRPEDRAVARARAAVSAYLRSGPYPRWPYRGAERVQEFYREGGIVRVRELIRRLREDPRLAQKEFDAPHGSTEKGAQKATSRG